LRYVIIIDTMTTDQPIFRASDQDDAITVQVSDTNCHLGQLLLEADWSQASNHLETPEGRRDVDAKNDPLGLLKGEPASKRKKRATIPSDKKTAFFAALYVRAPYDVIEQIFNIAPSHVDQPTDLMYVLSVIPTEEKERLQRQQIPCRTRAWTAEEYNQIINLLLKSFISSKTPSSSLLSFSPSWVIGNAACLFTPLAIAAYNPDIPVEVLQLIYMLEPNARDKECSFFGADQQTLPIYIAAASPLPPKETSGYKDAKVRRWDKVYYLTLPKEWYGEQREIMLKDAWSGETYDIKQTLKMPQPPRITVYQVQHVCADAIKRSEWELVREFLKNEEHEAIEPEEEVNEAMAGVISALVTRDNMVVEANMKKKKAETKKEERSEWLHKNMGPVMYPINTLTDLIGAMKPPSKKKKDVLAAGIVQRMS